MCTIHLRPYYLLRASALELIQGLVMYITNVKTKKILKMLHVLIRILYKRFGLGNGSLPASMRLDLSTAH